MVVGVEVGEVEVGVVVEVGVELIRRTKASHRAISLLTLGPVSSLCSVSLERLHLSPWSPFKPWRGCTWSLCAPHMLSACTAHALCAHS